MRVVRISKTAERKLDLLLNFLVQNWSIQVKNDFVEKLDRAISIIRTQPESFPASSKEKGVRKCLVTKQTTLYYRFDNKNIYVLTIFDNRKNPSKKFQG